MTTVELAYNAKNKAFMAHAACQKWVTKRFYGEITPRDLPWGLFKCPDYLKVGLDEREESVYGENRLFSVHFLFFQCGFGLIFLPLVKRPHHQKNRKRDQTMKNELQNLKRN